MGDNHFEFLEEVCANTPDGRHYLLIQAKDMQNGEIVWAAGDVFVQLLMQIFFATSRSTTNRC